MIMRRFSLPDTPPRPLGSNEESRAGQPLGALARCSTGHDRRSAVTAWSAWSGCSCDYLMKRDIVTTTAEITSKCQQALKEANMIDMNLEIDVIPVSDVERSKQFYQSLGWRFDDDTSPGPGVRTVQFTPPGSGCSVTFGKGITAAMPGSAEAGLTVADIMAAHDELAGRGINVSEMWHGAPFPPEARIAGPDPEHTSYGSFFSFSDPDGNAWLVQEVTTRLPGRV